MAQYKSLKDYLRLNNKDIISQGVYDFIKANQTGDNEYCIKDLVIHTLACQPSVKIMKSTDIDDDLYFTIGISVVVKYSNLPIGSLHYYNISLKGNAYKDLSDLSIEHIEEKDSEESLQKETLMSLFGLLEIERDSFEEEAEELYTNILSLFKYYGIREEDKYKFPIDMIEMRLRMEEFFTELPSKCVAKILMGPSIEKIYLPESQLSSYINKNLSKGAILLSKDYLSYYNYFPDRIITVTHELIHWIIHQSFYKIMKIIGNDNRFFKYIGKFDNFDDSMSSLDKAYWLAEFQAEELSYRLSMPKHLMEAAINECIDSKKIYRTIADYNEDIVKELANMFDVPSEAVKKRLMQLGYGFAEGTLVKVDGEVYQPFTFPMGILSNKSSYLINKASFQMLLRKNKEFAEIIEKKEYVYTGYVVCYNDEKYICSTKKGGKLELTNYARDHIEECCIIFNDDGEYFIDVHVPVDSPNSFNREYDYVDEKAVSYELNTEGSDLSKGTIEDIKEYNDMLSILHEDRHKSFVNTVIYHMKTKGENNEPIDDIKLAELTTLSPTAIDKICKGETKKTDIRNVMALCIAFELNEEECYDMFEKAGYDIRRDTPRNRAYRYLFSCTGSKIDQCNKILRVFGQEKVPYHRKQLLKKEK